MSAAPTIDLLAKCLQERTDCAKAVPLPAAAAAAASAATAVSGLVPVVALLLKSMRDAGAGELADVVTAATREEEAAQVQLENTRVKEPALAARAAVVKFQVALDATASHFARACSAMNSSAADRAAALERARMETLVTDGAAVAQLAADVLRMSAPVKTALATALETLTRLRRPEIAQQLEALRALHAAIDAGDAALRSASTEPVVTVEVLRRALNLSSKKVRALCAQVLAHDQGSTEDAEELTASMQELKGLLAAAKSRQVAAQAGVAPKEPTSLARLDARDLQAERDLAAANETVERLESKLAGVEARLKRARLQGIMAKTRSIYEDVARFQQDLRKVQKQARRLQASMAKHQEGADFHLDVGEQSRAKCVAKAVASFGAHREKYVQELLNTLRAIFTPAPGFSAQRRQAAEAKLAAAFYSASLSDAFPSSLQDRFYAVWRDLCAGNETLIKARTVLLLAHVFKHVQDVENGAMAVMQGAERV